MNSVEMCCSRLVMSQFESPELRLSADFYLPGCDVQKRQRLIKKLFEQNDKAILDSISRRFTTVWSSKIVGQIVDQASAAIQSRRSVASLESTIGACHSSRETSSEDWPDSSTPAPTRKASSRPLSVATALSPTLWPANSASSWRTQRKLATSTAF
eukprot:TRINITY_DN770_c3_g1_i10.p1 TRINITY_DN770_c3_g1~~TRINITY_DN770_c3_g1_i10.p1  ORF type:complete len:156 (+),score=31.43 TRINITY_DN770_c3_g1_i10:1310-1777(+)